MELFSPRLPGAPELTPSDVTPQGEYVTEDTLHAIAEQYDELGPIHYLLKGDRVAIKGGDDERFHEKHLSVSINRRGVNKSVHPKSGITFVCTDSAVVMKAHNKRGDRLHLLAYDSITSVGLVESCTPAGFEEWYGERLEDIVFETDQGRTYRCTICEPSRSEIVEAVQFISKQSDAPRSSTETDR